MTRLIIDCNAVLNAALLGGTDPDGRSALDEAGKTVKVNTALYGVERFFDYVTADLKRFNLTPVSAIGVWDGANSKTFRQVHLPGYKVGRDKHPLVSEQLNLAREEVQRRLRDLGTTQAVCKGREADDVIALLVRDMRLERNIISTVDGDLSVLVDENTDVWRAGELNVNPYGPFPHKFITLYKALVGDTSDKIPGAKGFGDAAWVDLVRIFGIDGLEAFVELFETDQLHRLKEDLAAFPKLKTVLDNQAMAYTSWRVAKLHPNEVNTLNHPLEWTAGMVKQWHELDPDHRMPELRGWYGTKTLVTAANYEQAKQRLTAAMQVSPFVALDIETSSGEESDDWMVLAKKREGGGRIDVLGHELTGMSLTFGDNLQHTIYMTVDHKDSDNISVDQCREMVEVVPQRLHVVIQNRNFEFSVLYRTWGEKWKSNGWAGFIPNALDTKLEASYVDENLPKGLKQRSKLHLDYEQVTYEQVTTLEGPKGTLRGGEPKGEYEREVEPAVYQDVEKEFVNEDSGDVVVELVQQLVTPAVTETWERRQYKMRELNARQVFDYGCDDTICTATLHVFYRVVMELEQTWHVYLEVEQMPEYLTTLAFVQGTRMSMERLVALEIEDKAIYEKAWSALREYLFELGWVGTRRPVYTEVTPANVKEAAEIVLGEEFTTRKRKLPAIAEDLRAAYPDNETADLLANIVAKGDADQLTALVERHFTGEPQINFDSPKQVQKLLYGALGMTPRLYNKLTEKERANDELRDAFAKLRRYLDDPSKVEVTPELRETWMKKASTDDSAVELALVKDDLTPRQREAVEAYLKIKEITTRIKMFYTPYKTAPHWRDGLIHSSMNQCEAVTRRYSSSEPNLQQLPARGEGVKFRTLILPHHDDAIIVSMDFNGQELRLMAEQSGDEAMISCYVGDNLRDIHSLIAVQAAPYIWGSEIVYEEFMAMRKSDDEEVAKKAGALRDNSKTVNFGTQYDLQAPNLAIKLKTEEEVAQQFIDAKDAAFPGINLWKSDVRAEVERLGYTTTMLGARRHLATVIKSGNKWEIARAGRQGPNFKIQGSGAEMAKLAMKRQWAAGLYTGRYDARFIAPIHDETVSSVHRDHAVDFIIEKHAAMVAQYAGMKIPVVSTISIGRDFSAPIEIGETPDPVKIRAAIDKLFSTP